jgi:hypothetical protein
MHCENIPDTVSHLLLHCPLYDSERYIYLTSRGPEYTQLKFLLFAHEALEPLFDYLQATSKFVDLLQ